MFDRKILAKILFWRLSSVAGDLLSSYQHCWGGVQGRSTFSAVLAIGRLWNNAGLLLDGESTCWHWIKAKAFDRVNHEIYLWLLLGRYGLQGRFIDWLKTLYKGAESFPLVNGWVGRPFEVGSGVRQGCPLSPLL
ncbi:unnamed protein product [Staurois parvus]|uniref:Reverse transcriptase domain-containing protein n=1 Tax=Staurois parvus TaxID=386267 RepID=A0ABN9EX75_9NEOB|nr:unnamed protein product [Staurois parvus]